VEKEMSVTSDFNLVTFQNVVDYLSLSNTGSMVYLPAVMPIDGSQGNQMTMTSGSLQSIINASLNYIVPLISKDTATAGFTDTPYNLSGGEVVSLAQSLALDYIGFRLWVTVFGGLVVAGWDYRLSELSVTRAAAMGIGLRGLVDGFKVSALSKLNTLQPISIAVEGVRLEDVVSNTAPSFY
jgi:hypothetical protein